MGTNTSLRIGQPLVSLFFKPSRMFVSTLEILEEWRDLADSLKEKSLIKYFFLQMLFLLKVDSHNLAEYKIRLEKMSTDVYIIILFFQYLLFERKKLIDVEKNLNAEDEMEIRKACNNDVNKIISALFKKMRELNQRMNEQNQRINEQNQRIEKIDKIKIFSKKCLIFLRKMHL